MTPSPQTTWDPTLFIPPMKRNKPMGLGSERQDTGPPLIWASQFLCSQCSPNCKGKMVLIISLKMFLSHL